MANSIIYRLMDMIEDVKKTDEMITLHQNDSDSDFMLSQYQAKKVKLTGDLINELNTPPFKSTAGFMLIKRILDKFYTYSPDVLAIDDSEMEDLKELASVL